MNNLIIIGNIGKVIAKEGFQIISIATDAGYMKDNAWVEGTDWHNAIINDFKGKRREFSVGDLVSVEGSLRYTKLEVVLKGKTVNIDTPRIQVKKIKKLRSGQKKDDSVAGFVLNEGNTNSNNEDEDIPF